jgi:hypothetical protein
MHAGEPLALYPAVLKLRDASARAKAEYAQMSSDLKAFPLQYVDRVAGRFSGVDHVVDDTNWQFGVEVAFHSVPAPVGFQFVPQQSCAEVLS